MHLQKVKGNSVTQQNKSHFRLNKLQPQKDDYAYQQKQGYYRRNME